MSYQKVTTTTTKYVVDTDRMRLSIKVEPDGNFEFLTVDKSPIGLIGCNSFSLSASDMADVFSAISAALGDCSNHQ